MPLSQQAHDLFEKLYGISLEEVSADHSEVVRIRDRFGNKGANDQPDHHGRGYVGFGKSVSAKELDQETERIIARW